MFILEYLWLVIKQSLQILAIGFLPYLIFAMLMQKISDSIRNRLASLFGVQGYVFLTAPGVMIHELSHAFFCIIFRHEIVEMKLFSPEEDGTLGYVNHRYDLNSRYQRIGNFFIGTGPVWGGILSLWIVTLLFLPSETIDLNKGIFGGFTDALGYIFSLDFWSSWQSYVWLYLVLTISSHITLSTSDLHGAAEGGVVLISTVILMELLFGWSLTLHEGIYGILYRIFICISGVSGVLLLIMLFFAVVLAIFIRKH